VTETGNIQTPVHLPPEQYEWLRKTAFARKVSQSQVIRELIEQAMNASDRAARRARP